MIFNDNETGNVKFLDNQVGLEIAKVEGNNKSHKY